MRLAKLLVVAASALLLAQAPDPGVYIRSDGSPCPPEGSAKDLPHKMLNRHKNRFMAPDTARIDTGATLAAMIEPPAGDATSDEDRFDPERGATITGFVRDVKAGGCEKRPHGRGGEGCNCNATVPIDCDTHIEVALSTDAPENQRVIVEVTPRFRKQMRDLGKDWSTNSLKATLIGKWVEFTGWLLFDFEHVGQAENTSPGNPTNWCATCWEIHPVTSINILPGRPDKVRLFAATDLKTRQAARTRLVDTDPKLKKRITERNDAMSLLYKEDGEEAEEKK